MDSRLLNSSVTAAARVSLLLGLAVSSATLPAGPVGGASGASGAEGAGSTTSEQGVSALAQAELERRQVAYEEALFKALTGKKEAAEGKISDARASFASGIALLQPSPSTLPLRNQLLEGFAHTSMELAFNLAAEARYQEARTMVASLEGDDFDRWREDADDFLKRLDDPVRYNPSLSPEHLEDAAEVVRLLHLASSQADLGLLDQSAESYNDVLRIDPYNAAARKGLTAVGSQAADSSDAGRNHMRAKALAAVDDQWEASVTNTGLRARLARANAALDATALEEASGRISSGLLKNFIVNRVDFLEAPLADVVAFLVRKTSEEDPSGGISMVIKGGPEFAERSITLNLSSVPLSEVLRYVADQAGMRVSLSEYAVELVPLSFVSDELLSRTWTVPPTFIQSMPVGGAAIDADPFAAPPAEGESAIPTKLSAQEFLEAQGVEFPGDASAFYDAGNNRLTVRNTLDTLDLIDQLVGLARGTSPKQVEVRVTIIDIDENNMKELGFDWLLGAFNLGGDSVFGSGGVLGNVDPTGALSFPSFYPSGGIVGRNPLTSGNRGIDGLTTGATIDDLIAGIRDRGDVSPRSPAPLAITGAFTDPQFQTVMRALDQGKSKDLLAAPSVVARGGQRAKIEVIREFPYPVEFEPPEIPETSGITGATVDETGQSTFLPSGNAPYTPTTPTAFEIENLGITLEVEAVIAEDNRSVNLSLAAVISRFDGFIDYGSAITTPNATNASVALDQPNAVLQPVFSVQKTDNNITVYDQSTIVMASTINSTSGTLEDQHPLFGRTPGAGRAFQSKAEVLSRRNIVMFVTVRIIDPGGNLINAEMNAGGLR